MNGNRLRVAYILGILALAVALLPSISAQAQGSSRRFPETGKTVRGSFLKYWTEHGGLAQQGYPISDEMQEQSETDGKTYTVQYFERAVFELHPENRPPHDVLLSLLGNFEYNRKYPSGAPDQQPNRASGSTLFRETGKRVGGKFLAYWRNNGGLAQQGYPISDEFIEKSELDGRLYRVQYFERAVFEFHPEKAGTPYEVLLSQLGTFRYQDKYVTSNGKPGDRDGDNIPDESDECPRVAENINKVFDTDGCADTIQTLMDVGAEFINDFWVREFEEANVEYTPPREIVPYTRPIQTACGRAVLQNAFYCGRSHGIYYDINFLQEQLDTDGDFAPVTILAHEWGHLVQGNLGILDAGGFTIDIELQADCFAGAWAADAGEQDLLDEGDLDEGAIALFRAGDDIETPWFDPDAHGQPQQRVDAFQRGLEGGSDACFEGLRP